MPQILLGREILRAPTGDPLQEPPSTLSSRNLGLTDDWQHVTDSSSERVHEGLGKLAEKCTSVVLADGRTLAFARFGASAGFPVFFMHGFPSSRLEAELLHGPAKALGVSLFAPDRPGFGRSDFQPGHTILDWADDLAELADALRLERFWIVGGSGGCPYALACAYRLSERVIGAATVAGLGPTSEKGAVRQMGTPARIGFALANGAPSVFSFVFGALARLVGRYPRLNLWLNKVSQPDQDSIALPKVRAILENSVREAFRQGADGAIHELSLFAAPWGFPMDEILTPLQIWHGIQDGVVPHAMAEILARRVKNAELRLLPNEGHVSLPARHGTQILSALVPSSGALSEKNT